jgi:ribosomal protein L37AE/L43A
MLCLCKNLSFRSFEHQTENTAMRLVCPHCATVLDQHRNSDGLNYCTNCETLFRPPPQIPVPVWILGVVTILLLNWQILFWHASR